MAKKPMKKKAQKKQPKIVNKAMKQKYSQGLDKGFIIPSNGGFQ
jgi:hypothetical protein